MSMGRPQGGGLELAKKQIASCISELDYIQKSSEFLRASAKYTCQQGIENTTASGCQPIGFDASLNCRLAAPTPPRSIKILSWEKAIEYFVKLVQDLDVICSYSLDPSLEAALQFVVKFQKLQPDLVARAHLQILLVQDGKLFGRDPNFAVITKAAGLPEVTKNHDIQKNEFMAQLGHILGMAHGLNLLFHWDLFTCVFLTATGAIFHLLLAALLDIWCLKASNYNKPRQTMGQIGTGHDSGRDSGHNRDGTRTSMLTTETGEARTSR
ncbi:hypothetical protein L6164_016515 [Bauhinia variegata]|uniref:Uncharacterized protein n=1 Tax=Bauhinia variegata TaxID=167791 RepID=A0ACB9NQB6_BAUVA|nr:hypothetical protein L6164_016515 [Bauhinia variegata]